MLKTLLLFSLLCLLVLTIARKLPEKNNVSPDEGNSLEVDNAETSGASETNSGTLAATESSHHDGPESEELPENNEEETIQDTCDGACHQDCASNYCNLGSPAFYNHKSGSAQAYKPNAPMKLTVCDTTSQKIPYRVASWPFSRGNRGPSSPTLRFRVKVMSCNTNQTNDCCCGFLVDDNVKFEVWQARPDGVYSSVRNEVAEGDCRATVPVKDGNAVFETLAPGSTGVLGGLGPSGFDFNPYGAPHLHMLVTAGKHEPLLLQVPVLMHHASLARRNFWGPDMRGAAYVLPFSRSSNQFNLTRWEPNTETNRVDIDMVVYLIQSQNPSPLKRVMCGSSLIYGTTTSFFLEPISICAPTLLSFFSL